MSPLSIRRVTSRLAKHSRACALQRDQTFSLTCTAFRRFRPKMAVPTRGDQVGFFLFTLDLFERVGRECRPALPLISCWLQPLLCLRLLCGSFPALVSVSLLAPATVVDRNGLNNGWPGRDSRAAQLGESEAVVWDYGRAAGFLALEQSLLPLQKLVLPERASLSPRSEARRQQTGSFLATVTSGGVGCITSVQGRRPPSSEKTHQFRAGRGGGRFDWQRLRTGPLALLTARHRRSDHRGANGCGPSAHDGNGPEALQKRLQALGQWRSR